VIDFYRRGADDVERMLGLRLPSTPAAERRGLPRAQQTPDRSS